MGHQLILLSQRQPYRHERLNPDMETRIVRPVSGLLSAVEPMMRAHGGTWIARSCGNADIEHVDAQGAWATPAGYRLRRLFFNQNEIDGHTRGFSNSAIWPLCHIAYQKPEFRRSAWRTYEAVNARFAEATWAEAPGPETKILVQDFHLALVPELFRRRLQSRDSHGQSPSIALFWHIPWPSSDVMARCPWISELITGMLGSDVIGFHTPEDCDRFIDCCRRLLDLPVRESSRIILQRGRQVRIRPFPVSIAPAPIRPLDWRERRDFWAGRLPGAGGLVREADPILLAVDRVDPTKGIIERLRAFELVLERRSSGGETPTLVQVATPCRTDLPEYRHLAECIERETARINARYSNRRPPVILFREPQDWASLSQLYQMSDVCVASPLHDGMNLVAKEYVWCQQEGAGALVLSRFAGAARELGSDAWLVNPHDPDGFAETLAEVLGAPEQERRARMARLRSRVRQRTAEDWGNEILEQLDERV